MAGRGLIRAYLRRNLRVLLLLTALILLFAGVCSLYGLPREAAGYCIALAAFLLLIFGGMGYLRFRSRIRELELLRTRLAEHLPPLPVPEGRLEETYQALLRALCSERTQQVAAVEQARREQMDYYTLWAHQVKTPLAAMRLLLRAPSGASAPELEGELIQLERYVDMALSFQRLDSESTDFVFVRQPLEPIVRGVVRKLARLFTLKHLALEMPPMSLVVLTDSKWLAFVLEQLLTNAIKYTPDGGKITLEVRGNVLSITDTGIGIRPEDLPRVCEKGFTGCNGRAEERSTGLGLYLCKRVTDKLGHPMHITSPQGVQVTLTFNTEEKMYE